MINEPFSQSFLQEALAPRPVRYYPETGSTNDDALAWLRAGAPDGALVLADEQVNGRGRLGRVWYAPPGASLLCSIILRPPAAFLTRLTMIGALSVYDVLVSYDIPAVGIKWPNDVRVGERKICGVLPEAAWEGNQLIGAALGIGLNVNIPFIVTPLAEIAVSLSDALGEPMDRLEVLRRLLTAVDGWSAKIERDEPFDVWRSRLVTLGQYVTVSLPNGVRSGIAEDVLPDGALLLRKDNGDLEKISAGELGG
jgi:BirA family biotin operon repressor/biotin-[acetyl-CoA-carboxylase] ligase